MQCAINQVTQCETEPQDIESTNIVATLYSKARATTLKNYNLKKNLIHILLKFQVGLWSKV